MTTWTKELPKERGEYWWRDEPNETPEVVRFETLPEPHWYRHEVDLPWTSDCGVGEFWPIRLKQPPEQEQTITVTADMWNLVDEALAKWKASDQTPQDIRIYAASIPRVEVKIDPNQPNA